MPEVLWESNGRIEEGKALPELLTEYKKVTVADGSEMQVYYARPATASRYRGLVLFQEAFGVNEHIRTVAERFARENWVVVAPELFHRTAPGFQAGYNKIRAAMPHMQALTEQGLEADIRAAHNLLRDDSAADTEKIASVGFCMGGRVSFLAATVLPLKAAVSFYGGGIGPSASGPGLLNHVPDIQAPVLLFWGGLDKHIGHDQPQTVVSALRAAKKKYVNVEISDADHGFFCDAQPSYNPEASVEAWALTKAFFDCHVGKC
jgi:carboxymethylenebutenolidase